MNSGIEDYIDPSAQDLVLYPDTNHDHITIEGGLDGMLEVFLVEVCPFIQGRRSPMGLVVIRTSTENATQQFSRIGVFAFDESESCADEPHSPRVNLASVFNNVKSEVFYFI